MRCMTDGTHHVSLLWAFRGYNAAREASCDDNMLCVDGVIIVLAPSEGVKEIRFPFVWVEE